MQLIIHQVWFQNQRWKTSKRGEKEEEQERVTDRQSHEQVKIRLEKIAILPCHNIFTLRNRIRTKVMDVTEIPVRM
jgi:hypothetical protein